MPEDKEYNELGEPVDTEEERVSAPAPVEVAPEEADEAVAEEPESDIELETEPDLESESEPELASPPRPIHIPEPVTPIASKLSDFLWGKEGGETKPEKPKSELDDMFEVPQETDNDIYVDDLFEVDEEDDELDDDMSDLVTVTEEDVMGPPPKPRRPKPKFRRTGKPYTPPDSMGGVY